MPGGPREAWEDFSAAAKDAQEALAYRIEPRANVRGTAAIRGRLPGGVDGFKQFKSREARLANELKAARKEEYQLGREDAEAIRATRGDAAREALAGWNRIEERNRELGGMTPGEADAAARRRRM